MDPDLRNDLTQTGSRIQVALDEFIAEVSKGIQSALGGQECARALSFPIGYFTQFNFDIEDLPWDAGDPCS